jgi:hypothetical protein
MIEDNSYKIIQEKFPFLTIISHLGKEHLGIIQNADNIFVSIYVMDMNFTAEMKRDFLECGDIWWWESNRTIPINMFLKDRFKPYRKNLKTFVRKDTVIIQGPIINLKDLMNKRVKRKTIQLVRATV